MPCTDPIADFLTVIRNAARARKDKVTVPVSNLTLRMAEIFKDEGFLENAKLFTEEKKRFVRLHLKYLANGKPVIQGIKRVSKPGLRVYRDAERVPRVQGGLGLAVVSTSKGLLTDKQARKEKVGGEVLCTIW